MKAIWNGKVIAESDQTVVVEGNHYFPLDSLHDEYFSPSDRTTNCPWKGRANYLDVEVDGARNADAAWTYRTPSPAASAIEGRVAFWKGVQVVA